MFHYKDGLFFDRLPNGSVNIVQTKNGEEPICNARESNIVYAEIVDANGWASVVASVSALGEGDGRYYEALDFHMSKKELK